MRKSRMSSTNLKQPVDLRDIQLVIFAGGAGTRFFPTGFQKALLDVAGKPLIYWQIRYAIKAGFRQFIIELGYKADVVRKVVLDNYPEISDNITFHLHDWDPTERPYGTGRALYALIRDGVLDVNKPVLTLFTDDLFRKVDYVWDLIRVFERAKKRSDVCGAVLAHPTVQLPYGVVYGKSRRFEEKPTLDLNVSTGMYIISDDVRLYIDEDIFINNTGEVSFEKYMLEPCSRRRGIAVATVVTGDWLPLNDWKAIINAEKFLSLCSWAVV